MSQTPGNPRNPFDDAERSPDVDATRDLDAAVARSRSIGRDGASDVAASSNDDGTRDDAEQFGGVEPSHEEFGPAVQAPSDDVFAEGPDERTAERPGDRYDERYGAGDDGVNAAAGDHSRDAADDGVGSAEARVDEPTADARAESATGSVAATPVASDRAFGEADADGNAGAGTNAEAREDALAGAHGAGGSVDADDDPSITAFDRDAHERGRANDAPLAGDTDGGADADVDDTSDGGPGAERARTHGDLEHDKLERDGLDRDHDIDRDRDRDIDHEHDRDHDGDRDGAGAAVAGAGAAAAAGTAAGAAGGSRASKRTIEVDRSRDADAETNTFAPLGLGESAAPTAPTPPKSKSNRVTAFIVALVGTLVYGALFAVAFAGLRAIYTDNTDIVASMLEFATTAAFYLPVIAVGLFFIIWSIVSNRAGHWSYAIASVLVTAVAYFAYHVGVALQLTINTAGDMIVDPLQSIIDQAHLPAGLVAALLAALVVTFFGAIIASRGRRLYARGRMAQRRYERQLAEYEATGAA